jgi:alpha-tubulin suppressor-like RCC1 family protein
MKKVLALLMAGVMVVSFVGCNTDDNEGKPVETSEPIILSEQELADIRATLPRGVIAVGTNHTVAVKDDGTVVATGKNDKGQCDVSDWIDIVAVTAGTGFTVGLKSDGTVVSTGNNSAITFESLDEWTDIKEISAGAHYVAGLKTDGTVVIAGSESTLKSFRGIEGWTDIVQLSSSLDTIAGLRADGTVIAVGWNQHGQLRTGNWKNIVSVAADRRRCTLGLRADGTVVVIGDMTSATIYSFPKNVSEWNNIIAISGEYGLRADGTVTDAILTEDLTDIVAIAQGSTRFIALRADGTVVAPWYNEDNDNSEMWDVGDWTGIRVTN